MLPPPPEPWPFQQQSTDLATKAIAALGRSGVGASVGFLSRVIRAALLDKTIYREVAIDSSLRQEAMIVMVAAIALASFGGMVLSLSFQLPSVRVLVSTLITQSVVWLVRVWIVRYAASTWLNRQLDFQPLFQAMTYAQAPAAFAFLPVIGQAAPLWAIVTNTAAVRDLTAATTVNAAILAVGAFVVGILVTNMVRLFI